jgi:hypothetical protein
VARLDLLCAREVRSITDACWLASVRGASARPGSSLDALVAAAADPIHDASLDESTQTVRSFLATEERRARSGAPFALARWEGIAPGLATYPNRDRVEAEWLADARERPALERAVAAAAWLDDPLVASAGADAASLAMTLLLCATGRTAHARFTPLLGIGHAARTEASAAFRAGQPERWGILALEAVSRVARRTREAILRLGPARERDDRAIAAMGRAGITGRRVLEHLHAALATTMPMTSVTLDLSRPAAAAALDRLVADGVAREVTGRARDRVYAWAAPLEALAPLAGP